MAVLQECPICHKKQSSKNRICNCGQDLFKAKRSQTIRYWIHYRLPGGKQRKEFVGYSFEDAKAAEGKRLSQKKECRIFDMLPESKMTFQELTDWYLNLEKVKSLAYYKTLKVILKAFGSEFGHIKIIDLKPVDLENYQAKRKKEGLSDSYIDQQIGAARAMCVKAYNNGMFNHEIIRTFRKVKKLLKKNSNARDLILLPEQFKKLMSCLPIHLKPIISMAYHTGMRRGEILNLTWRRVDLKNRFITLEPKDTKDKEARIIPICDELYSILKQLPRGIHNSYVFFYIKANR